jgi:osmotically-inducible protein OsmY
VLLPSDHFVADEPALAEALHRAVQVVNPQPHKIILLGIEPNASDPELGYIVPGALWNAFIVVADITTLVTLFKTRIPAVYGQLQEIVQGGAAAAALYPNLPTIDFSREILEGSESILRVLPVAMCGWTDLGTPQRVVEVLRHMPQLHEAVLNLRKFRIADRGAHGVKSGAGTNREDTSMKTDTEIRRDVQTELEWDPSLDESKVGVIVHNGVVTLTGEVAQFADRWNAEDITQRVAGVAAIANEIQVRIPIAGARSDTDIAEAAANALRWHVATAHTQIKPVVKDGWVTLSGEANWGFQRNAAEAAMRHLLGVKGVTNNIRVASLVKATDVKRKIEDAFKRHALLDANDIEVKVDGGTVTLQGRVHSWQEREDAARASWAAPGVANVENRLSVQ